MTMLHQEYHQDVLLNWCRSQTQIGDKFLQIGNVLLAWPTRHDSVTWMDLHMSCPTCTEDFRFLDKLRLTEARYNFCDRPDNGVFGVGQQLGRQWPMLNGSTVISTETRYQWCSAWNASLVEPIVNSDRRSTPVKLTVNRFNLPVWPGIN